MMPRKTQRRGWVDLITNANNDDITIAHDIISDTHTYIYERGRCYKKHNKWKEDEE